MTSDDFRRLALSFPDVIESSHMGHPDFRVNGNIFATLHYPDKNWGMVKLPPEHQQTFVQAQPEVFVPVKGAWGRQGSTNVQLQAADASTLSHALGIAWRDASARRARNSRKSR